MDWQPIAVYDRVNSRFRFESLKHVQTDAFNPQNADIPPSKINRQPDMPPT